MGDGWRVLTESVWRVESFDEAAQRGCAWRRLEAAMEKSALGIADAEPENKSWMGEREADIE